MSLSCHYRICRPLLLLSDVNASFQATTRVFTCVCLFSLQSREPTQIYIHSFLCIFHSDLISACPIFLLPSKLKFDVISFWRQHDSVEDIVISFVSNLQFLFHYFPFRVLFHNRYMFITLLDFLQEILTFLSADGATGRVWSKFLFPSPHDDIRFRWFDSLFSFGNLALWYHKNTHTAR